MPRETPLVQSFYLLEVEACTCVGYRNAMFFFYHMHQISIYSKYALNKHSFCLRVPSILNHLHANQNSGRHTCNSWKVKCSLSQSEHFSSDWNAACTAHYPATYLGISKQNSLDFIIFPRTTVSIIQSCCCDI